MITLRFAVEKLTCFADKTKILKKKTKTKTFHIPGFVFLPKTYWYSAVVCRLEDDDPILGFLVLARRLSHATQSLRRISYIEVLKKNTQKTAQKI